MEFFQGLLNMSGASFAQHMVNGISLGSLYALIAIGYTMVYGILLMINFAHVSGCLWYTNGLVVFWRRKKSFLRSVLSDEAICLATQQNLS